MVRWRRRTFLKSVGAAAVAAPYLSLLAPRRANATSSGAARRLVIFFTPNGTIHDQWRPVLGGGGARDFTFAPGSILEPLAAYRDRMVLVDGLDFIGVSNHEAGMAAMLTGGGTAASASGGRSVDQFIATRLGADTPLPSLELGVHTSAWGAGTQTRMLYGGPGLFVHPDDKPAQVYGRLFPAAAGGADAAAARLRRRRSILDRNLDELNRLRERVGAEERARLDQHLAAVRAVERRLSSAPTGGCAPPLAPIDVDPAANDGFPAVGEAQLDLLVAALACGRTRVASLQWSHTVGPTVFSWLGLHHGHHSLSHYDPHNAQSIADYVTAERWYSERFGGLLDRLAAAPEPDGNGSLLDHTLVVWAQELGDGRLHECTSVPFVLAGCVDGGRYLRYDGAPHQKLLVSICQRMGVDVQVFGDPSHGVGPLEGL